MPPGRIALFALAAVVVVFALPRAAHAQVRSIDQNAGTGERRLTKPPEVLKACPAEYPAAAREKKRTARVPMLIDIGVNGRVTNVVVTEPQGDGFDEAAVAAVQCYEFSPAQIDGEPSEIRVPFALNFTLREETPAPPAPATENTGAAPEAVPPTADTPARVQLRPERIRGRVRIRGGRNPLGSGTVLLTREGGDDETADVDENGAFVFRGLPAGTYTLVVQETGFERTSEIVTLGANDIIDVTMYLQPAWNQSAGDAGEEIVVRRNRERTTITRTVLEGRELTTVPGSFGDPLRAILNLPGFARPPFAIGAIIVRGSDPNDSGIFIDGNRVPGLFHFLGGPSVLNPRFLESVEFEPGNASVRYGRFTVGLVEAKSKTFTNKRIEGQVDVDLFDAGLFIAGPLGAPGLAGALSFRRSYIDAILSAALDPRKNAVILPVYYDYQAKIDYQMPRNQSFSAFLFGSDDTIRLVGGSNAGPGGPTSLDTRISFHRVKFEYKKRFDDGTKLYVSPATGCNITRFAAEDLLFRLGIALAALRVDLERPIVPDKLTWRTGLDFEFQQVLIRLTLPLPPTYRVPVGNASNVGESQRLRFNVPFSGYGFYTELIYQPIEQVKVIGGVRGEVYQYGDGPFVTFDPRIVGRYTPWKGITFKAGVGTFSRPPAGQFTNSAFGNPALRPERSIQYSLGYEHQFTKYLFLDTQVYYLDRWDLAQPTDRVEVNGVTGQTRTVNFDNRSRARGYGWELLLRHAPSELFYGWLAYTLSRSEIRQTFLGRDFVLGQFDQTHNLVVVGSWRLPLGFEAGFRFRLSSGRIETPIVDGTFDAATGGFAPLNGRERSKRLRMFHQLDIRIDKRFRFNEWMLSLYLDIQNVYWAKNPEFLLFDYRFRQSGTLNGLPILPTLGIEATF